MIYHINRRTGIVSEWDPLNQLVSQSVGYILTHIPLISFCKRIRYYYNNMKDISRKRSFYKRKISTYFYKTRNSHRIETKPVI